ncbi:hypothetical protein SH2C18_47840 [Clostridium sediminicola]|uniref:hypothetical protein n=1 Tax=Clostridium sediminicola TaxID=3114879 RepID=UPI0031F1CB44
MLKLTVLEFLLRTIPESFISVLISYLISNTKIQKKTYIISSLLFAVATYLIRLLPIDMGVHSLIIFSAYIPICVIISKIPINKAIFSIMSAALVLILCELVNVFIIVNIFKINVQTALVNPVLKTVYLMPSLFLYILFALLLYKYTMIKRKGEKCF